MGRNVGADANARSGRFAESLHAFPQTHHVECVATLEPIEKRR
ncbi:hypothetical protein GA0115244_115217 [Streptomyces sp. DvalAA-19]|nr:hypothetical protein GA0115244_115217 [Streptomyces sp. DvalAA-19]